MSSTDLKRIIYDVAKKKEQQKRKNNPQKLKKTHKNGRLVKVFMYTIQIYIVLIIATLILVFRFIITVNF